jgi:hypothetical protein
MKRGGVLILIISLLMIACRQSWQVNDEFVNETPDMSPDFKGVTVPVNIAPLNFKIREQVEKVLVSIQGRDQETHFSFKGNDVIFPLKKWSRILQENAGDSISICVTLEKAGKSIKYKPFRIFVSGDPIDGYLVYRILMPGFQNWNQMGIYQRSLSTFKVNTIIDSHILPGTCMNCHSFAGNDPENMVFHLRESYGGTMLYRHGKLEKLNTKAGKMFGNAAFPYWHPSKKFIAFSVNRVNQIFHATGPYRAAALDVNSDIFVYDIDNNEMRSSDALSAAENFESFPCFSPDGLTLYYCSARSVAMPKEFDQVKYSLCSVPFDTLTGEPGGTADTLISGPEINKSISIPRVSPDGRFLMFNMSDYGCFPSYNPEADIWMLNMQTGIYKPLDIINSNNVDSYHTWSSNSRWVAFSSRRKDGLYSNVYIAYIDENGNARKPFLLPQKAPDFYDTFLFSFNVPEFIKSKVTLDPYQIEKIAKRTPGVQVTSDTGH